MPPRPVKKNATTPTQKKVAAKTPVKTPKSSAKPSNTPPAKPESEVVHEARTTASDPVEPKAGVSLPDLNSADPNAGVSAAADDAQVTKASAENGSKASIEEGAKGEDAVQTEDKASDEVMEEAQGHGHEAVDGEEAAEGDEGADDVEGYEGIDGEGEEDDGDGEGEEGAGDEDQHEGGVDDVEEHRQGVEVPAPVKERRKQKEFEVFVGGLDKDAVEDDLKKVFGEVGEVVEVRLAKNPHTQKNKGFAFIRFATVEQAKKAVKDLKNPEVRGKRCGVSRSQDNETLYVRNICRTWTKDALRDKLKEYGVENVEEITLMDDPQSEGMNRGFAFLEFNTHLDATHAFKRLQKRDVFFGDDVSAKVAFAKSGIEPDEEVMAQVKSVFVDGLPASWDEERVQEQFKKYGEIEKVQLARNMPSAKRKDFGFVCFTTREAALACIEGLNDKELVEGDNKVTVKATLRKPLQKGRSLKDGVRGGYSTGRGDRVPWGRGAERFEPRRIGGRGSLSIGRGGRFGVRGGKHFLSEREYRHEFQDVPDRSGGRYPPPFGRAYDRRPPAPVFARSSARRDYREENEPYHDSRARSSSRVAESASRRSSYRDNYGYRGSSYTESMPPRRSKMPSHRSPYPEDSYSHRVGQVSSYRDVPGREYDTVSGSKRPYSALDDDLPYSVPSTRNPRSRLDYDVGAGASHYDVPAYGESARLGDDAQIGYGGGARGSIAGQQSYGLYEDSHQSGSLGSSRAGAVYSSGYKSDYLPGGTEIDGGSYSSIYSSRSLGGSYLPGGGSGSYY